MTNGRNFEPEYRHPTKQDASQLAATNTPYHILCRACLSSNIWPIGVVLLTNDGTECDVRGRARVVFISWQNLFTWASPSMLWHLFPSHICRVRFIRSLAIANGVTATMLALDDAQEENICLVRCSKYGNLLETSSPTSADVIRESRKHCYQNHSSTAIADIVRYATKSHIFLASIYDTFW
ncbi:hypothetical protein IG631_04497 [Alternaria alternata]|nr:hypothetical protein IG631_04497 [Alternaria alternata]